MPTIVQVQEARKLLMTSVSMVDTAMQLAQGDEITAGYGADAANLAADLAKDAHDILKDE